MLRRFQFSLRALLRFYAIAMLAVGLVIATMAFGQAIDAAEASALAEVTESHAASTHEAFQAAFKFLESGHRRRRAIFVVCGLMVSAASVPLFLAAKRVP